MQHHLIPLGPPSAGTRINDPAHPVVVGYCGDRVLIALDVNHAQRLAALLALFQAGTRPDLSALAVPPVEREEWMKAMVDVLASAAIAAKSQPARVLPVSWGPRIPDEVGHQEAGEVRIDVSRADLPTTGPIGGRHLHALDWSPSIEDAGELDDTVVGGFICPCGWAAIDKGPAVTPSFNDDVTHHTETCQFVDDEQGSRAAGQRLTLVKAYNTATAVAR